AGSPPRSEGRTGAAARTRPAPADPVRPAHYLRFGALSRAMRAVAVTFPLAFAAVSVKPADSRAPAFSPARAALGSFTVSVRALPGVRDALTVRNRNAFAFVRLCR